MSDTHKTSTHESPVSIFVSYAREDRKWLDPDYPYNLIPFLAESLRRHNAIFWYDRELQPGDEFKRLIESEIDKAQIALLLVSQSFLNSEFIEECEMPRIHERAKKGEMIVVPVLIGPCNWQDYSFLADRQMVPSGQPLIKYTQNESSWEDARYNILGGLREQIKRIRERHAHGHLQGVASQRTQQEMPDSLASFSVGDELHASHRTPVKLIVAVVSCIVVVLLGLAVLHALRSSSSAEHAAATPSPQPSGAAAQTLANPSLPSKVNATGGTATANSMKPAMTDDSAKVSPHVASPLRKQPTPVGQAPAGTPAASITLQVPPVVSPTQQGACTPQSSSIPQIQAYAWPSASQDLQTRYLEARKLFLAQQYESSEPKFAELCDSGVPDACGFLGVMAEAGRGLPLNLDVAVRYYKRACFAGDPVGCLNYGRQIESGAGGVCKDVKLAANIYSRACALGQPDSCTKLKSLQP